VEPVGRVFVGVPLTMEVRGALAIHLAGALGDRPLPGRPVPPENWHLTLRFLGRTEMVQYEKLLRALEETELGEGFRLGLSSLGAFPRPARATVLWLGIDRGREELAALAAQVAEAVERAGFPPEERPFAGHLTLSRIRPHQDVRTVIEKVPRVGLGMQVERVVVFRSHLGGGRPARYEELESFALATQKR
jgi:2'-5' RNA ligase